MFMGSGGLLEASWDLSDQAGAFGSWHTVAVQHASSPAWSSNAPPNFPSWQRGTPVAGGHGFRTNADLTFVESGFMWSPQSPTAIKVGRKGASMSVSIPGTYTTFQAATPASGAGWIDHSAVAAVQLALTPSAPATSGTHTFRGGWIDATARGRFTGPAALDTTGSGQVTLTVPGVAPIALVPAGGMTEDGLFGSAHSISWDASVHDFSASQ
jgi:hypothetical protein